MHTLNCNWLFRLPLRERPHHSSLTNITGICPCHPAIEFWLCPPPFLLAPFSCLIPTSSSSSSKQQRRFSGDFMEGAPMPRRTNGSQPGNRERLGENQQSRRSKPPCAQKTEMLWFKGPTRPGYWRGDTRVTETSMGGRICTIVLMVTRPANKSPLNTEHWATEHNFIGQLIFSLRDYLTKSYIEHN